jgi:hypothetical protein
VRYIKTPGVFHKIKDFTENRIIGDVPSLKRYIWEKKPYTALGKGLQGAAKNAYRLSTAPGKILLAGENLANAAGKIGKRRLAYNTLDKFQKNAAENDISRATVMSGETAIGFLMWLKDAPYIRRLRRKVKSESKFSSVALENAKKAAFKSFHLTSRKAHGTFKYAKKLHRANKKLLKATRFNLIIYGGGKFAGKTADKIQEAAAGNDGIAVANAAIKGVQLVTGRHRNRFFVQKRKQRIYRKQKKVSKLQSKISKRNQKLHQKESKLQSKKNNKAKAKTMVRRRKNTLKSRVSAFIGAINPREFVKNTLKSIGGKLLAYVILPSLPIILTFVIFLILVLPSGGSGVVSAIYNPCKIALPDLTDDGNYLITFEITPPELMEYLNDDGGVIIEPENHGILDLEGRVSNWYMVLTPNVFDEEEQEYWRGAYYYYYNYS